MGSLRVSYSRLEATFDLCAFWLQNTTEFFYLGSIRQSDVIDSLCSGWMHPPCVSRCGARWFHHRLRAAALK